VRSFAKPAKDHLQAPMRPVAPVEPAIRDSSKTRDIALGPFGCSGLILIAAGKTGRQARLVELDPGHADVIVKRWQLFRHARVGCPQLGRARCGATQAVTRLIASYLGRSRAR
jgi:DNA modification methylase